MEHRGMAFPEVYPRACGGTVLYQQDGPAAQGLSPRLRGNLNLRRPIGSRVRSIPALAGEPGCRPAAAAGLPVYPRACGGTWRNIGDSLPCSGLSPRLRGNLGRSRGMTLVIRSIPALAGEPHQRKHWPVPGQVYPRACGGTSCSSFGVVIC